MFPHSDTVYAVHNLRLQDDLQYAARQRLAATARDAAGIQPLHVAASESLGRIAKQFWRPLAQRVRAALSMPGPRGRSGRRRACRTRVTPRALHLEWLP